LDMARLKSLLKTPLMVDLRNIYRPTQMREAGFEYISVGRP
jgi:UDPglucose 6-dehydrogenase